MDFETSKYFRGNVQFENHVLAGTKLGAPNSKG